MRKLLLSIISLFIITLSQAENDPLKVETYKLKNGLTVYLNEDHTMPMVHGMVAVRGGAKRDPKDATGIAHYFEHIMFKGTDKIGTIDFETEKVYLDSISELYDKLGATIVEKERIKIQKNINRISLKAAEYAIPNEFDKIINNMGGSNVNAGTGFETIMYYNSFPSNQINKWIELYSHRFENPVFRLFQSELEAVYEEKNISIDDPMGRMFEDFSSNFYKNSPYGQQTILGEVDHLKNPSLKKMYEYYDTYYVANNMALVIAGDFNANEVKPLIEKEFGNWKSGETPKDLNLKEDEFKGREFVSKRMTPIKVGILGYRTVPQNHPDELALEVCTSILTNQASTGLLDKLVNDNKIMMSFVFSDLHSEIGGTYIAFVPKIVGQSLKKAEKEITIQLDKFRAGDFSEELLAGVKIELQKQYERNLEDMRWRTYAIMDAFLYNTAWNDYVSASEKIQDLTKEDIVKVANKYFGEDYLAYHSKMGFPKKTKLSKPPYKPVVPKNTDAKSDYAQMIEDMPTKTMSPKFIEFDKDVLYMDLLTGIKSYVTPNPINDVFSIRFNFGKGSDNDKMIGPAVTMIQYAHPEEIIFDEFKKQLQLLGCSFYAYNDLSSTTLNVTGLEENFDKSLALIYQLLNKPVIDDPQLKKLIQEHKMEVKFEKKELWSKSDALKNYALYGNNSNFINRFSSKEIKSVTTQQLESKLREVFNYEYEVHYCGNLESKEFNKKLIESFDSTKKLTESPGKIEKERIKYNENTILIVNDKQAVQSHINIFVEGNINPENERANLSAFNEYIGGNMSSIIFQEIREFRSLAYGTRGKYNPSFYFDKPGYFAGWLTTQSDKTIEAIDVYTSILKDMPKKPERMDELKNNLTLSINTQQPGFRHKSDMVSRWQKQGYNSDPRKKNHEKYKTIEFDNIENFYKENIHEKNWVITIVGDTKRINMEELAKYGKVKEIKLNNLFTE